MNDTRTAVIDSRTVEFLPVKVSAALTNAAAPLDCGHRHVTGDTIWTDGGTLLWCTRCVEEVES